jgi:hypothetical protein
MISQLHQLLLELIPGGAKTAPSAAQAKTLLASVRPRDAAGKARRRVAAELISDLERVYQRSKAADKELAELVAATASTLMDLHGSAPSAPPGCWSRSATSADSPTATPSPGEEFGGRRTSDPGWRAWLARRAGRGIVGLLVTQRMSSDPAMSASRPVSTDEGVQCRGSSSEPLAGGPRAVAATSVTARPP